MLDLNKINKLFLKLKSKILKLKIFFSILILLDLYYFYYIYNEVKKNPDTLVLNQILIPIFLLFFISVILYSFIKTSAINSEFMKEYKKNLINIFKKYSKQNYIDEVLNKSLYIKIFKNLKSIPNRKYMEFEDFLEIADVIYFETKIYNKNNKGQKNRIIRYSCLVLERKNNKKFHIISKNSSFVTTDMLKFKKRQEKLITTVFSNLIKYIVSPFFRLIYFPVNFYLKKTKEFEKAEADMKKQSKKMNINISGKKSKAISFKIIFIYLFYTILLYNLFNLIDFKGEDLIGILYTSIFGIIGISTLIAYITKKKEDIGYKDIELDNNQFNKYFDIHTTDSIESYKFLSPKNLEKLLNINNKRKNKLAIETHNDFIFIIFENEKNMFEFENEKKLKDLVKKHLKELKEVIEIKNQFNF